MKKRSFISLAAALTLVSALAVPAAAAGPWETADVIGQGPAGPVVAVDGAAILRTPHGVTASLSMTLPETYTRPTGPTGSGVAGHPEAFSLWVFIFWNPDACDGPCDRADLIADSAVVAGGFNGGGHVEGGATLNLAGHVNPKSLLFGGGNAESFAEALSLGYDLAGAEIHLAVAPHGALDPALLPDSISTPVGLPDSWWLAFFFPID